jgi:hypothetical protein
MFNTNLVVGLPERLPIRPGISVLSQPIKALRAPLATPEPKILGAARDNSITPLQYRPHTIKQRRLLLLLTDSILQWFFLSLNSMQFSIFRSSRTLFCKTLPGPVFS